MLGIDSPAVAASAVADAGTNATALPKRSARWRMPFGGLLGGRFGGLFGALLVVLLAVYFALMLGLLALRYYIWPHLDEWRPQIVAQLSKQLGQPVRIGQLHGSFDGWWQPMLAIEQIQVGADEQSSLTIASVRAVLSPRSLFIGRPRFAHLQLISPVIKLRRDGAGVLWVAGVPLPSQDATDGAGFDEFLAQRRLQIQNGTVDWHDESNQQHLTLLGLDGDLENLGRRHRLSLQASALQGVSQQLKLVGELYRTPLGKSNDLKSWQGDLFTSLDRVSAQAVQTVVRRPLPFSQALADIRFWARVDSGQLNDMSLKLAGDSMQIEIADAMPLTIKQFALDASAIRRSDGGHDLIVRDFIARADGDFALRAIGEQTLSIGPQGTLEKGRLAIEDIDLTRALAWAKRARLPPKLQAALLPLKLRGRLSGLTARFDASSQLELDAQLNFDKLSLLMPSEAPPLDSNGKQRPGVPSLENVSGSASIRADGGTMSFSGENAALTLPGVFSDAKVPFDTVRGKLDWKIGRGDAQAAVSVTVRELNFANKDAAGALAGHYQSGGHGGGLVDLKGGLSRGDAARVARYLPMQLSPKVRNWVRESIISGRLDEARFVIRGDLADFPYRDPSSGEFTIDTKLADGVLDYEPRDWPRIEKLNGRLRFERTSMDIAMDSGRMFGFELKDTSAKIDDFKTPMLTIAGNGTGPVQDMVRFINESPVRVRIDDFTRNTVARGNAQLELKLDLPLENMRDSRVRGAVQFDRNELTLDDAIPPFDAVSGRLEFGDDGLQLKGISASFLGGPLQVDGQTTEPGRLQIRARGKLTAQDMRKLIDNPLTQRLTGATDYRANVDVIRRSAVVTVESDLIGLASDLPEPFNKAAAAAWPIRVVTTPTASTTPTTAASADERSQGDRIDAVLNGNARLVFARKRHPTSNKMLIERGAFAYDAEPTMLDRGFVVLINRKDINLDKWLDILTGPAMRDAAGLGSKEFAEGFSMLPSVLSIVADRTIIGGKELNEVVLGASRQDGFWRANISAREVNGYFNWREARDDQRGGALTARFTRLEIPNSRRSEIESLLDAAPADLPSLDVTAEEFVLADLPMGRLSLAASNSGTASNPSWSLNSLRIDNPAASFQASGNWAKAAANDPRRTQLEYRLNVLDSGELLNRFGMHHLIKGGSGNLSGTLSWDASPFALQIPSLRGTTSIAIGKGQFLKTEPGIAKLIGVLNMQFLSRRLSFDFSDLFAEGFSFDNIIGDFTIDKGVASTNEISMTGVSAKVKMKGRVNLATESQAMEVEVRPELNAGLASLAYAALANPALGLTTFVAQALLRQPLEDIFTALYDVTGSWAEPVVSVKRRPVAERVPFAP